MGPGREARGQPAEVMGLQSRAVCVSGQTPEHRVAQTHLFSSYRVPRTYVPYDRNPRHQNRNLSFCQGWWPSEWFWGPSRALQSLSWCRGGCGPWRPGPQRSAGGPGSLPQGDPGLHTCKAFTCLTLFKAQRGCAPLTRADQWCNRVRAQLFPLISDMVFFPWPTIFRAKIFTEMGSYGNGLRRDSEEEKRRGGLLIFMACCCLSITFSFPCCEKGTSSPPNRKH